MNIIYEPHPVSQRRKQELRAKGLTIIDARFKPKDLTFEPKKAADLTGLDAEELHALAKDEGVKVAHNAGAERVREAILEARG